MNAAISPFQSQNGLILVAISGSATYETVQFQSQNGLILVGPKFALFALTFTIISPNLYIYFAIPDLSIVLYGLTTFKSDFFEILSKYNHNHLIFR